MKFLQVSQDIIPIGEFKSRAAKILRELKTNSGHLVVTQNGKPAAVLMAPQEFDALRERVRFMSAVVEGLADSKSGRVVSSDEMDRLLDERFGKLE